MKQIIITLSDKISKEEIKTYITKGKGNMPPGLVPEEQAAAMADWVSKIK